MQTIKRYKEIIEFLESFGCDHLDKIVKNCRDNQKKYGSSYMEIAVLQWAISFESGSYCSPSDIKKKQHLIEELEHLLKNSMKYIQK